VQVTEIFVENPRICDTFLLAKTLAQMLDFLRRTYVSYAFYITENQPKQNRFKPEK